VELPRKRQSSLWIPEEESLVMDEVMGRARLAMAVEIRWRGDRQDRCFEELAYYER